MSIFSTIVKGIGAIGNEIIKESTGIDIAQTASNTKKTYEKYDTAYKSLIENKDVLIAIHGYDWFERRKEILLQAGKSALKGEIYSACKAPYTKVNLYVSGKLDELSDEELIDVSKREKNINNPKVYRLIKAELQERGL